MNTALEAFLNDPAGLALKGALIVAFVDFVTGSFAALRDGTFALNVVAAFLRKHILGRVAPLGTMLLVGYFGGDAGAFFVPFAITGLTAYALETASSIKGNFSPPSDSTVAEHKRAAVSNPVPTE